MEVEPIAKTHAVGHMHVTNKETNSHVISSIHIRIPDSEFISNR